MDFNALTHADLQSLVYGNAPIPGNAGPGNQLVDGDVFAIRTNAGNFAKVKVITYGYDMKIQWITYHLGPRYRGLGTGSNQPEDIVVTSGGRSEKSLAPQEGYAILRVGEEKGRPLRLDVGDEDVEEETRPEPVRPSPPDVKGDQGS